MLRKRNVVVVDFGIFDLGIQGAGSFPSKPMLKSLYTRQYEILLTMLRDVRLQAGMTQAELAHRLDMSQSDVSKCELGSRRLDVIELKSWLEAIGSRLPDFLNELDARLAMDATAQRFNARPRRR
jgi:DNA-binding XRE family transcriptional regulator